MVAVTQALLLDSVLKGGALTSAGRGVGASAHDASVSGPDAALAADQNVPRVDSRLLSGCAIPTTQAESVTWESAGGSPVVGILEQPREGSMRWL